MKELKQIKIKGYSETWSAIESMNDSGENYYLMQNDYYGDEVFYVVINDKNKVICHTYKNLEATMKDILDDLYTYNLKHIIVDIYLKNMSGYSSASCYKYIRNKGIEPLRKYQIDKDHEFMALAGKGSVSISVYYRGREINDVYGYLKRQGLI